VCFGQGLHLQGVHEGLAWPVAIIVCFRQGLRTYKLSMRACVPRKEPEGSNVNSSLKRCIRILIKFLHSIVSRMSKSPNKIASYFTQNLYNFQLFKTLSRPRHKYTTPARWYYIQVKLTEVVSQIAPTLFYFLLSRWARLRSSSNACIVSASNPPANCIRQEKNH